MARTEAKVTVNNFIGGLNTDHHPLNTPQNVTVDEDNCDLDRKGSRKRRLGIDYEEDYEFSDNTVEEEDFETSYFKTYEWECVANDANRNFLVVQIGNILEFYDMAFDSLSPNRKSFEVDLNDYLVSGAVTTSRTGVQVASGKGALFVVGKYNEPFFIQYDPDTDTITETETPLEIRDLVQQENDTSLIPARPTVLTDDRKYDLFNQGWSSMVAGNDSIRYGEVVNTTMNALDYYFYATDHYPPKSKPWHAGKRSPIDPGEGGFEIFDPTGVYDRIDAGNSLAPLGHYILNPFSKDRSTVSGIAGFEIETDFTRPTAVAVHSGRVFYGHKNTIYFSQLLNDDLSNAGLCYQAADPTAEDINELIATDGGTILIPSSGETLSLIADDNSLLVYTDNGLFAINGASPGDGFSATGFSVNKITSIGISSNRSLVDVEGDPYWWSDEGIFTLQADPQKQGFQVINICTKKVQEFYDTIPKTSLIYASGAYDKVKKVVTWIFNSESSPIHNSKYACDRCLNFDVLAGAFYPYTISDLTSNSPFIVDVFAIETVLQTDEEHSVLNSSGVEVVNSGDVQVVADELVLNNTTLSVGIKFLTFTPTEA